MVYLFGLGSLVYVAVLLTNAIAILSEDRFLARIGWGSTPQDPGFGAQADQSSMKSKVINLINSTRTLMRVPLIGINTLIIFYELVLG